MRKIIVSRAEKKRTVILPEAKYYSAAGTLKGQKFILVKGTVLAAHNVIRDMSRNSRLITQDQEPVFSDTFAVPKGAKNLRIVSKGSALKLLFIQ